MVEHVMKRINESLAVGDMLVLCWSYIGPMLVLCWSYVGPMLVLCWSYVGPMLVLLAVKHGLKLSVTI